MMAQRWLNLRDINATINMQFPLLADVHAEESILACDLQLYSNGKKATKEKEKSGKWKPRKDDWDYHNILKEYRK